MTIALGFCVLLVQKMATWSGYVARAILVQPISHGKGLPWEVLSCSGLKAQEVSSKCGISAMTPFSHSVIFKLHVLAKVD